MLGSKGKAVDYQPTGSVEESKISQGGIILFSQVLLLLETNGLRVLFLGKQSPLTI